MTLFGERFLIGSYLQVSLMICFRELQSQTISKSSWNCVGQTITLECPENAIIRISTSTLGYSSAGSCRQSDCTMVNTDSGHMQYLRNMCNGKRKCSIMAIEGKIKCSSWWRSRTTHFEYITYNCSIRPVTEQSTVAWSSGTESNEFPNGKAEVTTTEHDQTTDPSNQNNKDEQGRENDDATKSTRNNMMTKEILIGTICAIILIAIISLVVIFKRKKNNKKKLQVNAVEMSDVNNVKIEERNANADPKCNKQNPMPQSGNSSSNNRKEGYNMKNATHNPPDDTYETILQENEDIDIKHPETELRMSRSNIYGVVQNTEVDDQPGASASNAESLIYCDVETKEPIKATERDESTYQEACEWHPNQKKSMSSVPSATKAGLDSYTKVKKPVEKSKNPITQDEDTYKNIGEIEGLTQGGKISDSRPTSSPDYEPMTPGIPEDIYANESELPHRLVSVSTAKGTSGSESSYCDMQSPRVRFKEEGEQTLIENEIYPH